MTIKLDSSSTGIVVYCTECEYWRAFRFHKDDAWDAACLHEERVHPEDEHQRHARDERNSLARRKSDTRVILTI
ncbi:hypothetical protein [Microbacterium rhizomatis]|uniref:Uncharacterized protein n=1 Tax=Microbacterium rhizomatis TaxID=1631477 RepID=A0A5J5IY68_9MICO|nr:hypothetical protein [Microbacterium rhizomatis]KAA9105012.1 hypothetical protein F6B43_18360 [Microbacterium rhizomatis]